jgi:hypothetical protein
MEAIFDIKGWAVPTGPSEFGGMGGLQQPPPHEPSAKEKLRNYHHYSDPGNADVDPAEELLRDQEAAGYQGEDSL